MSFEFELLIHAANVLYLFAFMVRDILWLRILTVVVSSAASASMSATATSAPALASSIAVA